MPIHHVEVPRSRSVQSKMAFQKCVRGAAKRADMDGAETLNVLTYFFEEVVNSLERAESVLIPGFGLYALKFTKVHRKVRLTFCPSRNTNALLERNLSRVHAEVAVKCGKFFKLRNYAKSWQDGKPNIEAVVPAVIMERMRAQVARDRKV